MRFDKGLRGASLKPYPTGYMAPPTDGFNGEDPSCQWGGIQDDGQWLDDQALPSVIELQVGLIPVWLEDEKASACLDGYPSCLLYAPRQVMAKLCVAYLGAGQYQKNSGDTLVPFVGDRLPDYTLGLSQPYVYQKEFCHQPEGRQIQWTPQKTGQGVLLPLWAYGGQQMGDDVHPAVFTVERVREKTQITSSSLLYWRERNISPFQEGMRDQEEIAFQGIFSKDQTRTFQESIEAGMATFPLRLGVDERGNFISVPYVSCRLSKTSLFFKKGEK